MTRVFRTALQYSAFFLATLGLSWYSGVFESEFGRYQDEGMHYVTGLFVQDFLVSGHWSNPMQFARQYYLHLPKVGLGNWPPGFSVMQTVWALVFGVSRISMMFGMIVLTAWLALLVYRTGTKYFGPLLGAAGALLLIAAPLTQEQTAMVMAEIPLAAASFLAICALVRFIDSGEKRPALEFALWTFAAIMIKGNGWVVVLTVPVILLASGRLRLLRNRWLWFSAIIIGVLCVPYTLLTMQIVSSGWNTRSFPGFAYEWRSLGIHLGFVAHTFGLPLAILALCGAAVSLLRRDLFRTSLTVYGLVIILFHVGVPSSIEPRKIYQILPVMCLLILAGLDAVIRILPEVRFSRLAGGAVLLAVFGLTGFKLLPGYAPGFGPAVENVISRPESRGAAVLISSNPQWADSEAAIISEWAERRRNDGTFLIRGTKLLSHPVVAQPGQPEFELNYATQEAVLQALSAVPVSFVILHTTAAPVSYPHQALLRAALESDPAEWEPVFQSRRYLDGLRETHTIEIYRCRKDLRGAPIHYSVDLTGKVGEEITTNP